MRTLIGILFKKQYQSFLICSRSFSNKKFEKIQGIHENYSEYEVRLYFDEWLKSLWLAPQPWIYSTRDHSIHVNRCFVPFWNISFQGSIEYTVKGKSSIPFRDDENYYSHREWHPLPLRIDNVSLDDINTYAAKKYDRYHIKKLDVSFDNDQLIDLNEKDNIIEKPRIDQKKGFYNAWVLMMKPILEDMCLEEAKKIHPKFDELHIDSLHLKVHSNQQRLLYYPIYIINYNYKSKLNYTCLFDGLTGYITGDRQYSLTKVTLTTLIGFYPLIKIGLFSFGSLANLLFAFEIAADFSFIVSLPIALIIAPYVGLSASSYPKSYKQELSQVKWKQDKMKALKFTYEFIDSIEKKQSQLLLKDDRILDDISVEDADTKSKEKYHNATDLPIKKQNS